MPEHLRITHLHQGCSRSPPQAPEPVSAAPCARLPSAGLCSAAAPKWDQTVPARPCKPKSCLHVGGWKELGVQLQGGYCKHRVKLI